jgi:hypothetical protein
MKYMNERVTPEKKTELEIVHGEIQTFEEIKSKNPKFFI